MARKSLKDKLDILFNETIVDVNLEDIVGEAFGRYSKYIIQDRALPDVRDGLKPVQRRILFAMQRLGMYSDKPYKKSARIAGEVMGKYHPHGDSSIYEAMVRMSQYWKVRELLIDMHGNNGSVDGDPAAAMRYTEARLSKASELLLKDLDKKTVDFIPNFDDEEYEPVVLPAKYPNLLVNGATGISSGYATDIPPHNLGEIIDATIHRINKPQSTLEDILEFVKGPDFPTGGIVQGKKGIINAYTSGKGKILIRSKVDMEEIKKDTYQITITELPFDVNKAVLVKKIDSIRISKKIEGINEVRDESDREGLRIAIELKKSADKSLILNYLYKNTNLQKNYNFNMVAINNKRPVQMGILSILDAYIMHQKEVITNRSNFELHKCEKRIHILEGLIQMLDILDLVIQTIRESKNKSDAKNNLINKVKFKNVISVDEENIRDSFTEEQAEAIVTLQLYRLTTTDINDLNKEHNKLAKEINKLKNILSNENKLIKVIIKELTAIKDEFATPRKSIIEDEISDIKIEEKDLISNEDFVVSVTKEGYIKRSSLRSYEKTKEMGIKEGDITEFKEVVSNLDNLLIFTEQGTYLYVPIFKINETKWKDLGTHLSNIVDMNSKDKIVKTIHVTDFNKEEKLLLSTKNALVKQTKLSDFKVSRYSKAIKTITLKNDDRLVSVERSSETKDEIVSITKGGFAIRYNANEISIVGTQAQGVKSISLQKEDELVSSIFTNRENDLMIANTKKSLKRLAVSSISNTARARKGTNIIKNQKVFVTAISEMNNLQYEEDVKIDIHSNDGIVTTNAKKFRVITNPVGKKVDELKSNATRIDIEYREDTYIVESPKTLFD